MIRIGKYEKLSEKYMEVESQLTEFAKEESKKKVFEAVEAELMAKRNEMKEISKLSV